MLSLGCISPPTPAHHPFAHVALVATSVDEATADLNARPGAVTALAVTALAEASNGTICVLTCERYSSSDIRLLAIHGLTRKVGQRIDGASLLRISDKGREVLSRMSEI